MFDTNKELGWVKTYRSLLSWRWYKDVPTRSLWEHIRIRANIKDKPWMDIVIKRGQFVTSIEKLSDETGLSIQQVRTALKKLRKTEEITYSSTSRYTVITVNNYNEYQAVQQTNNMQTTNEQQTDNKQATTTKEHEEYKNIRINTTRHDMQNSDENFEQLSARNSDPGEDELIIGEFNNVHIKRKDYQKMLGICASQKLLDELVDELSSRIGRGKEKPYQADFPDAHFIALKSYWKYRMQNPNKFKVNSNSNTNYPDMDAIQRKAVDNWLKNGGNINGS